MRRWHFDDAPTSVQLNEIARILKGGGVVLLPTDTIYGLHALASDREAVERIGAIKGREETKPFIVLASSVAELQGLGVEVPHETWAALESIWPAPLTVILPLRQPIAASRGSATLAVRIPALEWLRELVRRSGPLVSTSANRSGEPPVQSAQNLAHALHDALDAIIDGGIRTAEPSAILDLASGEPRFIREGEFSFTQKVWKTLRKTL